jgi:2'-5' RNA ligase
MHLTLKFLGPVEDDDVTHVCGIVQEIANRYEAFELTCKGVGVFGHPARVVWTGVVGGPSLKKMQRELDERFTQAGWAAENRAFAAH